MKIHYDNRPLDSIRTQYFSSGSQTRYKCSEPARSKQIWKFASRH